MERLEESEVAWRHSGMGERCNDGDVRTTTAVCAAQVASGGLFHCEDGRGHATEHDHPPKAADDRGTSRRGRAT